MTSAKPVRCSTKWKLLRLSRFVTWASVFFALNAIQLMRMQERKTLNKNDLNSVIDQRFLLKQWFSISAHSWRLSLVLLIIMYSLVFHRTFPLISAIQRYHPPTPKLPIVGRIPASFFQLLFKPWLCQACWPLYFYGMVCTVIPKGSSIYQTKKNSNNIYLFATNCYSQFVHPGITKLIDAGGTMV